MIRPTAYPKSTLIIKPSNRSLSKVLAATNAVHATAHKWAINAMGGVTTVAVAIVAGINSAWLCTIGLTMQVMYQMMQLQIMQMSQWNAIYAILVKLI